MKRFKNYGVGMPFTVDEPVVVRRGRRRQIHDGNRVPSASSLVKSRPDSTLGMTDSKQSLFHF
jgi:hypothetical protein